MRSDFSLETIQAKREWNEIFKVLKEKDHWPRYKSFQTNKNWGYLSSVDLTYKKY